MVAWETASFALAGSPLAGSNAVYELTDRRMPVSSVAKRRGPRVRHRENNAGAGLILKFAVVAEVADAIDYCPAAPEQGSDGVPHSEAEDDH